MNQTILVTGGAGFIGANFITAWLENEQTSVVNLDMLTYAGSLSRLDALRNDERHQFVQGDIGDHALIARLLAEYQPRAIVHFAAESHVDRSIDGPAPFIQTNINGTFALLEAARVYWQALNPADRQQFRFLHISTDEVYGSLTPEEAPFSETSPYAPSSPYSASKAASDHLVRAYHHTYGLPTLTTHCSNNYGPYQFPEKLIPLVILHALEGKKLPVYGDGLNVRDWLYVGDHCDALRVVLAKGQVGQTYNIGGCNEVTNLEVVQAICLILDKLCPLHPLRKHDSLIMFTKDRPGHDRRYAINAEKITRELGWQPKVTFKTGLYQTVEWYLKHMEWTRKIRTEWHLNWLASSAYKKGAA